MRQHALTDTVDEIQAVDTKVYEECTSVESEANPVRISIRYEVRQNKSGC